VYEARGGGDDEDDMTPFTTTTRRVAAATALSAAILCAGLMPARAQIVAIVNGEPITATDIAQRSKLIQLSTRKAPSRQEVLDELIDDHLKVQLSKRYIAEVPKREIESAFATIARRAGMSPAQFNEALKKSGISAEALKARIHADFVWGQIVRGKFQGSLQVGDKDVFVALQTKNKQDTAGTEYSLRPIVFLAPKGSSPAVLEQRKKDAEGLRARFVGCDEGLRLAMTMPDVAVREMIRRQSADIGAPQREVLDKTEVGRLTPPEITMQGVETFAVCNKVSSNADTPVRREVRDEMFNERYQALSKKFLKQLRTQALIELR
jgi:peptidyl-prolyl cis-trans isomerase SurA